MKNLQEFGVQDLNTSEVNNIMGGWTWCELGEIAGDIVANLVR